MNTVVHLTTEEKTEKLLINGLLFCVLRSSERFVDKLKSLEKYLTKCADVNATDANDSYNTPLHVAVEKDEPEIVKFLLQKGANVKAINENKHTPICLATLSKNKNKKEIIEILENSINEDNQLNRTKLTQKEFTKIYAQISEADIIKETSLTYKGQPQTAGISGQDKESDQKNQTKKEFSKGIFEGIKVKEADINKETVLNYKNRSGTAGIRGQLYETKLLGLLLHRALHDHDIEQFYLGSNIEEIGAFDDIVFKYYLKNESRPKIFFIQAKHRDNPTKDKLTVQKVLKSNDGFSLDKYFESYIKITKKIYQKNGKDAIFQNIQHIDCSFIIYTSAVEQFHKKRLIQVYGKETLISTGDGGKAFAFNYDNGDVETLLKIISKSRAKSLAEAFAKNIASNKYKTMMWDEFIKIYHVFIAKNIVQICNQNSEDYLKGYFRKSFLESKDEIFVLMKETMSKELKLHDKLSTNLNKIDSDLFFKFPRNFGNFEVSLTDGECDTLYVIIEKLTKLGDKSDDINIIAIDDEMIGTNRTINERDMDVLRKLVGETLIIDNEIGVLKFNTEASSSEKTKILLEKLKLNLGDESIVEILRLDITVQNFPQLSLCNKKPLTDFLNKLIFYTDQEDEEGVENILKSEINQRYITGNEISDSFYVVKCDAIYLQYHDRIQKWWKNPKDYLTKSCNFYEESKKVISDSPLLNIYSYVFIKKNSDYNISFDQNAIHFLRLQEFIGTSNAKVFHISTKDKTCTSIKVIQYFKDMQKLANCKFIDFDVVTAEGFNEVILLEISKTQTEVIIIVISDVSRLINVVSQNILKNIKKLILITHSSSFLKKYNESFTCLEQLDQNNSFSDFDIETKHRIYEQKSILFQGLEVPLTSIVDKKMQNSVKEIVLHKVMSNENIKIGKEPPNVNNYEKNRRYYVDRCLCRCLYLNREQHLDIFNVVEPKVNIIKDIINYENSKDVLIITNDEATFKEACTELHSVNFHWFCRKDNNLKWKKSNGNFQNIFPYLKKMECPLDTCCCSFEPISLKDLNDRVVVISGEPGMGKTTLLTHLMMQTKHIDKSMCVIKLNLLDLKNEFSTWQDCDDAMRLKWCLVVLYRAFSIYKTDFLDPAINTMNEKAHDVLNIISIDVNNRVDLNSRGTTIKTCDLAMFEFRAFFNIYNNGKMSLILDGFDEICPDYKKQAIQLFKTLVKSPVQHLWISSRSYAILNELELELNTFAYTLKSFSRNEQISYLLKFWHTNCTETLDNTTILVDQFLNTISHKMNAYKKEFTATPLHLQMIAETYREYFLNSFYFSFTSQSKFHENFNLIILYEKFIEIKYHNIRFGEKRNCLCYKDPDIKMLIELGRSVFIENHKKLAAYALLDRKNDAGILTEEDLKYALDLIQRFNLGEEKTGIIGAIYGNEPKFVHFTYAEYFTCEFLCDKLKQNNESVWKYMINYILVKDRRGIRAFFDAKLENDKLLSKLTSKYLCDTLLLQRHSSTDSALNYAVTEYHNNISLFLLNNLNTYLNKDSLDDFLELILHNPLFNGVIPSFLFCTYNERNVIVMAEIIKIIIRLDYTKLVKLFFAGDTPIFNIFMLAFLQRHPLRQVGPRTGVIDNMVMVINHINPEDLTKLLCIPFFTTYQYTILHCLFIHNMKLNIMKDTIERLNPEQCMKVLSATDKYGRVPAHYAAQKHNFECFDLMESLVGKDQFKAICTFSDVFGDIPLRFFYPFYAWSPPLPNFEVKFRLLCDKAGVNICYSMSNT